MTPRRTVILSLTAIVAALLLVLATTTDGFPWQTHASSTDSGASADAQPTDSTATERTARSTTSTDPDLRNQPDPPTRRSPAPAGKRLPRLFGRVTTDPGEEPIEGVLIRLGVTIDARTRVQFLTHTRSDADGRFELETRSYLARRSELSKSSYLGVVISAHHDEYREARSGEDSDFIVEQLVPGKDVELTIGMFPGDELTGRVIDPMRKAVAGATVEWESKDDVGTTFTGPQGRFFLPWDSESRFPLEIKAYADGIGTARTVLQGPVSNDRIPDLELAGQAYLRGRLSLPSDEPVPAQVLAYTREATENDKSTTLRGMQAGEVRTDADGRFRIEGVCAGIYRFEVRLRIEDDVTLVSLPGRYLADGPEHLLVVQRVRVTVEIPKPVGKPASRRDTRLEQLLFCVLPAPGADTLLTRLKAGRLKLSEARKLAEMTWYASSPQGNRVYDYLAPPGAFWILHAVHDQVGPATHGEIIHGRGRVQNIVVRFPIDRTDLVIRAVGADGRSALGSQFRLFTANDELAGSWRSSRDADETDEHRGSYPAGKYRLVVFPNNYSVLPGLKRLDAPLSGLHLRKQVEFELGASPKNLVVRLERGSQLRLRFRFQAGATPRRDYFSVSARRLDSKLDTRGGRVPRFSQFLTEDVEVPERILGATQPLVSIDPIEPGEYEFRLVTKTFEAKPVRATVSLDRFCDLVFVLEPKTKRRR